MNLWQTFTVSKKERNERMDLYGEMLGITEALTLPIGEYSHGMKQKVAIISALVHAPKLILMDELFVGLDPFASHQLGKQPAKSIAKRAVRFSPLMCLKWRKSFGHKVAIIKGGNLVASGTMDEVRGDSSLRGSVLGIGVREGMKLLIGIRLKSMFYNMRRAFGGKKKGTWAMAVIGILAIAFSVEMMMFANWSQLSVF